MIRNQSNQRFRVISLSAYASGVVSIVGIVFLLLSWIVGGPFGRLNDNAVIIQYLLALPMPLALQQFMQDRAPALSKITMLIGIVAICAVVVLQLLLVVGALSFEQEVGLVLIALLVFGVWIVITGYFLGRSIGKLPRSLLISVLAALYFGYPIWAIWLARLLVSRKLTISKSSIRGETA